MITDINIVKIENLNHLAFKNLQQFYEFEFSSITKIETNKQAEYSQENLTQSWSQSGFDTYLIYLKNIPIGFVIVNLGSMLDDNPLCRDIAEFFIMPIYRKNGYGRHIAKRIFDLYTGKWEVRQLASAQKARQFWLKVIQEYVGQNFKEQKFFDPHWGVNMYIQTFDSSEKNKS